MNIVYTEGLGNRPSRADPVVRSIAKKQGLLGFSAEVLKDNRTMLHLFEKIGFNIEKKVRPDVYALSLGFRDM